MYQLHTTKKFNEIQDNFEKYEIKVGDKVFLPDNNSRSYIKQYLESIKIFQVSRQINFRKINNKYN